jgi:biotin synthase
VRVSHNKKQSPYLFKNKKDIIEALLSRGEKQKNLFGYARHVRNEAFSKKVEIRSVIEYSNICGQTCSFCGMLSYSKIKRYVLTDDETLRQVKKLYQSGRRVILFETGENKSDNYFDALSGLLKKLKKTYPDLVLNCALGNLTKNKYRKLREIGVERYLLKFETSNPRLYRKIKPSDSLNNRLAHIDMVRKLGFKLSSGNIVGLPGQDLDTLAQDLLLIKKLGFPMGSTSPFIPNELSPYAKHPAADLNLTLNFMAIMRIMCPDMLIPTVSALNLIDSHGQYLGLMAGANVITLHDGTPREKEKKYIIYKIRRHRPKDDLFDIARGAGLKCSNSPLA